MSEFHWQRYKSAIDTYNTGIRKGLTGYNTPILPDIELYNFGGNTETADYQTGGGYDPSEVNSPSNENKIEKENKQIGVLVSVKENHGYIIFSPIVQNEIRIGTKIKVDNGGTSIGEVSKYFNGFYSAKLNSMSRLKKGQKIYVQN